MPEETPWQLLALSSASTSTRRRLENALASLSPIPALWFSSQRRTRDATETLAAMALLRRGH